MTTYQHELLYEVLPDIEPLLVLHYEELTLNKDRIVLNPMWERYAALEQAGALKIYTARQDGRLIGYGWFFINQHMHYAELTVAMNDVLFVHPDYRTGRTGVRLIQYCEQELSKQLQKFKLVWHAKLSNELSSILKRMGYQTEEVMMAKIF